MADRVALTFDDGPDPEWTPRVLTALARVNVRATFFVIGALALEYADLIRETLKHGDRVEPHCWKHRPHDGLTGDEVAMELTRTLSALGEIGVPRSQLWRPPFGVINEQTRRVVAEHGLEVVTWTLQTNDWTGTPSEKMFAEIIRGARPNARLEPNSVVLIDRRYVTGLPSCQHTVELIGLLA